MVAVKNENNLFANRFFGPGMNVHRILLYNFLDLAKKKFAYKFNSYVVGTERETKISHSEPLSSNSLSRTQNGKISDKKIETMASKPIVATRSFLETPPT
jgi:hypothetical protein